MNKEQIDFLKSLDTEQTYGTIQAILMGEQLNIVPFEKVAKSLIKQIKAERDALVVDNISLSNQLEKINGSK